MLQRLKENFLVTVSLAISASAVSYIFLKSLIYSSLVGVLLIVIYFVLNQRHVEKRRKQEEAKQKINSAGCDGGSPKNESHMFTNHKDESIQFKKSDQYKLPSNVVDAFNLLGIEYCPDLTKECVRRSFHKKVRAYHPDLDRSITQEVATSNISNLQSAKKVCIDYLKEVQNG